MKHPIRRRLMYLGFQALQALVRALPLSAARALGRVLGGSAYVLLRSQRRLTLDHLRTAFGGSLSTPARKRVARGVFVNLGQSMVEWLLLPTLSPAALQQLITSEGVEHLRQALAKGNGAIIVTAHFGNWELIPLYLRSLGFEGGVLARRLRYPEYESFLINLRGSRGVPTYARGSIKEVAKVLRANQIIGMLPDQDMDSLEGVFVDFFGSPAYTPIGPAALSIMTGAPIVPCFIVREGARFRLVVEPPVQAAPELDRTQAMTTLTQAWSRVVESYIRRYPDQWVWMHRRWKTRPTAEGSRQKAEGRQQETGASQQPSGPVGSMQAAGGSEQSEKTRSSPTLHPVFSCLLLAACCLLPTILAGCSKPAGQVDATNGPPASTTALPASPNATQQMSGFTLTGYKDDGTKRWTLEGQGATADGDVVTIQRPDAVGFDVERTAYLTASLAHVNQTNRHVQMEHDVTIHTSDGLWFTSPMLNWMPDQNQMETDHPVRIETDHMLLRGRGAKGLTQLKQTTLFKDVELVLNPSDHDAVVPGAPVKQVTITCDGPLAFDYGNNIATFEQNVHVKDPNGDLYSDKLVAYLDQKTHTIRYAEATGRVRIHQNQNTALSERAVYEPAIGKITLLGKPSLLVYPSDGNQSAQLSFGLPAAPERRMTGAAQAGLPAAAQAGGLAESAPAAPAPQPEVSEHKHEE